MRRSTSAASLVLVLGLAACNASAGAPTGSPDSAPSQPAGTPEPTERVAPSVTPEPTPAFEGHPAAGLAITQYLDADNPASQAFVVEPDGTLRQVTGLDGAAIGASHPVWSPDRAQLAIGPPKVGAPGVVGQVGVVNADGSGERVLGVGQRPLWSPDGTRLLVSEVDDVTSEPPSIWIQDVSTGEITDLGMGFSPQWIGDGGRIGFRRLVDTPDGSFADGLFVMTLASGEVVQLPTESETVGVWSPDGSEMLIANEGLIDLAESDASAPRPLVSGFDPVWSPDGSRVLVGYEHDEQGIPILAIVDLEGREIWSGASGQHPTWSPDGTRIAVEIPVPEPTVVVLDAATGELLWESPGLEPAWDS
jgi:WD40-like Beta Propeller Repeat